MKLTHLIRLSLIFFLLTGNIISGQHRLTIIDRGSIRPVPDVYAICNDLQIAVSGAGGVMQLPESLTCDVLVLSHVGYHNLILNTSDLPADTTLYLNPLRKKKEYSVTIVHTLMDNRFRHFIRDDVDYRDNQLPGLPGSSLSIMLNTSFSNNLSVHATLRHISSQFLDDANTLTYSGHELADLSAIYRPKSAALRGLRIAGGIQNLFNRHHASMVLVNAPSFGTTPPRYYYPGTPRRFFLSLVFDTSYLQMF